MRYLRRGFLLEPAAGTDPVLTSAVCAPQNGSYFLLSAIHVGKYGSTQASRNSFTNVFMTLNFNIAFKDMCLWCL